MTPLELYDDLITEVENILRGVVTKNTAGESVEGVKGYKSSQQTMRMNRSSSPILSSGFQEERPLTMTARG